MSDDTIAKAATPDRRAAPRSRDQSTCRQNSARQARLTAIGCKATANQMLAAAGLGAIVGHKIGCTTPVMQAFLGIHAPCSGEVFASTVAHERARLRAKDYRRLGVECEIAVELARDITPDEAPFTRETIANAVGAVMAGIEIVDDRYADYRSFGVPSLIGDNFFNAGCVLAASQFAIGDVSIWRR